MRTQTPKKMRIARLNRIINEAACQGYKQHIAGETSPADIAEAFAHNMASFEDARDLMQSRYDGLEDFSDDVRDEIQADIVRRFSYLYGISVPLFGLKIRDDDGNIFAVDMDGQLRVVEN